MRKHGFRMSKTDLDALIAKNPGLSIDGVPATQPEPPPVIEKPKRPKMNKTETAYAAILDAKKQRGEIIEWAFEPFSLRYGTKAFYKPDFVVILAGALMTVSELRGLSEVSGLELASAGSRHFPDMQELSRCTESDEKLIQIIEIKGGHIFDAAKPRFKASQLRYPWAEFQMIQRRKGQFVQIL